MTVPPPHLVLLYHVVLWLREDAVEVLLCECCQLYSDGQPPLQLCQHITGLGGVEGTTADEQDVLCVDVAVLGGHLPAAEQQISNRLLNVQQLAYQGTMTEHVNYFCKCIRLE
jgi:hypothetical protein